MARVGLRGAIRVFEISARNAAEAYDETLGLLRAVGVTEPSRNGPVVTLQDPFMLTLDDPRKRVILCPIRNANPFFHLMEAIWMFAGQSDVSWLTQFNSNIEKYANNGHIHGAYGHRWFHMWGDQVANVIRQLYGDPTTRQAVIAMWDPISDHLELWKDRPCNTHIYFRQVDGALDMTVCNRSNDLIWGMVGSNIVHMTMLHELIATAVNKELGKYHVFTNNLHFYMQLYPNGDDIWENRMQTPTPYPCEHFLLTRGMGYPTDFFVDCENMVKGRHDRLKTPWMKQVAKPMHDAYLAKTKEGRLAHARLIDAKDWKRAAVEWLERKYARQEHCDS